MALGDAFRHVGPGSRIGPKPADGDDVQRAVCCSITASVEAMASCLRFRDIDSLDRLRAIGAFQQACPQIGQMVIQPSLHPSLIIPSMPGVRAPLDARTIRAASASHSRSVTSRRRRSNRRFGSLSAHVASLCCISLIIKGLHLVWSGNLHSKQIELFPFAMWQAFPTADYYGNSASTTDIRVNSLGIPSCLPSFICRT